MCDHMVLVSLNTTLLLFLITLPFYQHICPKHVMMQVEEGDKFWWHCSFERILETNDDA